MRKSRWYTEGILLFVCFMMFTFAPLELYLSGKEDYFFDGFDVVPFALLAFLASFGVLSVLFQILWSCWSKFAAGMSVFVFMAGAALYIQGNFILTDYGKLDGTPIDWASFRIEGIVSNGLFILLIAGGLLLWKKIGFQKLGKAAAITAACIFLVQLVTLTTLLLGNNGLSKEPVYISTTKEEFNYSTEDNFIVLLLDTYDSGVFQQILKGENAEEYKAALEDFTFFPDTLSMYSATDLSLPQILTGEGYYNEGTYGDYLEEAYKKAPFLNRLKKEKWDCGIYTISLMPQSDVNLGIENMCKVKLTVSSHRRLAEYMYRLVGFRYAPQVLKQLFWFYADDINDLKDIKGEEELSDYDWSNEGFYEGISSMKAEKKEKSYHFYHLYGTHPPFRTNADFSPADQDVGIAEKGKAMLVLVQRYLEELKQNGIYEDSTIVILADHGYLNKRQNPLLLVKGAGEDHAFKTSRMQVSYQELQIAFNRLLDKKTAAQAFASEIGRTRTYYFYSYHGDLGRTSHSGIIEEYTTQGEASDMSKLTFTGKKYQEKQ